MVAPNLAIDLTTLAEVKAWLGATTPASDDVLQRTITNVSRFIVSYLSRSILPTDYADRYDGYGSPGQQRVVLNQWPVIRVNAVSINNSAISSAPIPGAGSTYGSGWLLSPGNPMPPGAQQWLDFQGWFLNRGSQNVGIGYRAGYANSETWTIPATPFEIVPTQALGRMATDEGVMIDGVVATRVATSPMAGQYSLAWGSDGVSPIYTFAAADAGKIAVVSYGYVPQDLAEAALEMIAFRFKSREFIGLVSKSLGGQESVTFSQKDMQDPVKVMLQNYKRVF